MTAEEFLKEKRVEHGTTFSIKRGSMKYLVTPEILDEYAQQEKKALLDKIPSKDTIVKESKNYEKSEGNTLPHNDFIAGAMYIINLLKGE